MRPKPKGELTDHQSKTLRLIVRFIDKHGYAPTVREVAEMLDVQVAAAHRTLGYLRDAGHVEWDDGRQRTLRLL